MKKILIIEDEQFILDNTIEMLQLEQFDPLGTQSGSAGIQLAREHLPDLILCDIRMPEMDGYTVLEQLRQDSETAAIPFIFMSATTDASDFQTMKKMGTPHCLVKPFQIDDLLKIIQDHLKS